VTGNPVIDTLQMVVDLPYDPTRGQLKDIQWNKRLILVTAHRRENFGEPMEKICSALRELAVIYQGDIQIIYLVHLNPNVQRTVHRTLDNIPNIVLMDTIDYLSFIYLLKHATLILTDSGGIQEEAPCFGKPVLVLRNVTERLDAVEAGTVRVVGTVPSVIVESCQHLLDNKAEYAKMVSVTNPYGDGHAAERIVAALLKTLSEKSL
jgi:UDP-N-acetylglucosamine 2-epimerase (non-hydrolysing)